MATTTTLRDWWAPACRGPFTRLTLHGGGHVTVRTPIVAAVRALDDCLRVHDYRTRTDDTGAYNCRKITGGTGYSLHAYGIAVDLNWLSNPYGRRLVTDMPPAMVADIKAIRTRNGKRVWRWGGDYSGNKDAMHFEVICHPADMATGIDPASLPHRTPPPPVKPEEHDMHGTRIIAAYGQAGYLLATLHPDKLRQHWADIDAWTNDIYAKPAHERDGGVAYIRALLGLK